METPIKPNEATDEQQELCNDILRQITVADMDPRECLAVVSVVSGILIANLECIGVDKEFLGQIVKFNTETGYREGLEFSSKNSENMN